MPLNQRVPYRAAVIGSTGRGNYGHGLDAVWRDVPNTKLVAVSDDSEKGLSAAVRRLDSPAGFRDYRKMLEEAKPDLVSIGPRWLDQHKDMVLAAAEHGVKGIYLEKPLCQDLEQADAMIAACEKNKVKLAQAHQTRYSPKLHVIQTMIENDAIGKVLELRGRGKEDRRGGGEDLWVLGSHVMNLIHFFGGEVTWCSASLEQEGEPVSRKDVKQGNEGIGPLAGDTVRAIYRMKNGSSASFNSVRDRRGDPSRFGLMIYGSKGIIALETGFLPRAHWLPDSSWTPGRSGKTWIPISTRGPAKPETLKDGGLHAGNIAACKDLIDAIENDREPECSIYEARTTTEMILAVFESHRQGGKQVALPLNNRKHPLTMLR